MANSNFSKIYEYQPDIIKIDGSFIRDMADNPANFNIAKTISQFAKNIGASVVAEWVHSGEILQKVKDLGILFSQGFYIGPPADVILKVARMRNEK